MTSPANFVAPIDHYLSMVAEHYKLPAASDPDFIALQNHYRQSGYLACNVSPDIAERLEGFFDRALACHLNLDDFEPGYHSPRHATSTISRLNVNNQYFLPPPPGPARSALRDCLQDLRPLVELVTGSPMEVVNVRAWSTREGSEAFGPTAWHCDGVSRHVRKIMIYPLPPNATNGTLELIGRDGQQIQIDSIGPLAVLADVGDVFHRGSPPQIAHPTFGGRPVIEVTINPAATTRLDLGFHGHNAHTPWADPVLWDQMTRADIKALRTRSEPLENPPTHVNIGGGMAFNFEGWINFDAASTDYRHRIKFDRNTELPYPTGRAGLVYSSHCLEHLDDPTVIQILCEARRLLAPDGAFVVKLPDFDAVLSNWRRRDPGGVLEPGQWGLPGLFDLWRQNGVEPGIAAYTAMVFCGFWNRAYGDVFSGNVVRQAGGYHGPPRLPTDALARILDNGASPHCIAATLRSEVQRREPDYVFNHQNAWSRDEFISLAKTYGFTPVALDQAVADSFQHIPTITDMHAISAYYHFKPA